MAVGSGIASQVGIAPETVYGTFVPSTKFTQVDKCGLKKVKNIAQGNGMGAGRLMALGSRRVVTTTGGAGAVSFEVANKGMGLWLQALMGTTVTPVQQATSTAYLQTHTLSDNVGKILSIQHGVPDQSGTVRPYSFLGCKVTSAEFSFDVSSNAEVMATFDVDAREASEAPTLAVASYPTATRPFVGTDATIKLGTFGSEAIVTGVRKVTVKFERPQDTDRTYMGAGGKKAEPLMSDYMKVTGTISADFIDKTVFADRFASDGSTSIVIECVGLLIAGAYSDTFRIKLPMVFLDGDTPVVDGPDLVKGDFAFTCQFDGTNYPAIEVISTDVTL